MDNSRIMVVLGERRWTLGAIHLACAVARNNGSEVVLLHMVPVRHPLYFGTNLAFVDFTFEDQRDLVEYAQIPVNYGVRFEARVFQYATYIPALVQAADQFGAAVVFAALPRRPIPLWHRIEVWWLKKALSNRHRSLYSLEQPGDVVKWTPLIMLPPESTPALLGNSPEQSAVSQLPMPQAARLSQSAKFSTPIGIEPTHDTSVHSTTKTIRR